jgi:AcrR family transcriptional regulator
MPTTARRTEIAREAAHLMNRRGYTQTSVAELLDVTGLEKGGLYHHFRSKEDIALAAFDYAQNSLAETISEVIDADAPARLQLMQVIDASLDHACSGSIGGGCPMVNLSASAGDRHPELRARAARAMQDMRDGATALLTADPLPGEDPRALGDLIVSIVEGAIVVREVTGDDAMIEPARAHLRELLGLSS